ncbi:dedicator of cytokinesis protein 1 isoform X1 [Nymphalis io]|uniref:dedicator of cytokinesis protein 1 isoform X1 n=1 Tax=Inachis io TaxID=171585 RepID=UPI0021681966|nr:dedicator of cytokinesis protein 1 isoform X1 [Nymphalis io]
MTVWRKLDDEDCYAVALYNFNSSSHLHLPLEVGELVHLERETDDWYWGTSLRREAKGAFPKAYVVIRSCNVDRCGETVVASAGGSGVVHDIAVTLREWLQHWKLLYTTNDDRFKFMEVSMRALLELRAQAASGALPQDQLRRVARTAVFTIDKGNRTLGMELAVRTISGQLVDPLTTSTFKLNALHDEANSRIDKNMETTPTSRPTSQTPTARTYTIVVYIKNFVCRMNDTAELSLALHDSGGNKITENVLLKWPPGHLGAAELFTAPSVVFTDLGSDIKKEKIFLVCHVVRIGSMEPQVAEHRRSTLVPTSGAWVGGMRRPFGLASADITQHLAADNSDKEILLPFYPCEKDNMDTLLKKVIANRELKDKHSQGLWVFLQMVEGDLKQIRQENPHMMVGNTAFARKMGFPEVILPGDARNDLYVTLLGGAFSRGPGKSSERNVELTARVVDRRGAPVPGVISVGAGMPLVNEYTSIVYYHEDRPRWNEVFKVCLNIEEFKEAHIVFLCRHRSSNEAKDRAEKYFAMSYLRLMQKDGTTTPDTQHNLAVYKLEHKKCAGSAELEAGGACVALPSLRDELPAGAERGVARGPLALLPRDSLQVATKLCSTKLTQREEILGVLKWSAHHAEGTLRTALTKLLRVPNDELVKFLQDILDALFSILTQVEENTEEYTEQSYAVLVLDCLLQVISLVADHKYQHFQPVLHVYIERSFCDALAYEKLISIMVWTIRSAEQGEVASKRLLQCMKCLESLSRVLVRSWQLRAALGSRATAVSSGGVNGTDEPTYCPELQSLLEALVWLMRCGDHALTCQGSALKYLPHAAPHLTRVFPDTQLSKYTVWALEALPLGRLSNQRLHALLELARGPLGAAPGPRAFLLPHLANTLAALLVAPIELDNHKSRSAGKAARLLGADTASLLDHTQQMQIVELCVETLGEVVSLLARDDVGPVEADRGELARTLLPTVLRIAATMMKERSKEEGTPSDDPLLRKLICVLLDMVRQMSEEQYEVVMKSLDAESSGKANTLVSDALALMMALLQRPVFRPHWADMLHLQHYVMLHALRLLSTTLREQLVAIDDSDPEVVSTVHVTLQDWFNTLGAVASSPPIQLETLPTSRRQRATMLYGDIRRKAATLLADMWFSLEDHKRLFIPHLVGTFLEVSFLRVEEVRNIIIPLFFDMMQTEYKYTSETEPGGVGNMRAFENALIDKLDVLAEAGRGDAAWRASFVSLCGALAGAARLPGGPALVAAAARQLDALLQYRAAPVARRLYLVSGVLRFYEQIERPHMYIRYVHRLAALHRAAAHAPEAGLTLCLHAKLLDWSDEPLPPRLRHPTQHAHDTHFQLKSALYAEAMALLEAGRQWELAVRLALELVRVCDERGAAHGARAALHELLARLHRLARGAARPRPVYFRVRYLGRGFPPHLRHPKGFVYRGNDCDMLHNFKERMLDEWPEAEVLLKLDEPGEDITESDGQYLQINAVTPIIDDIWKNKFGKSVDEQIIRYYEHNNVKKFVFSRPFHRHEDSITDSTDDLSGANEFATRWLERTELEISDTLPGILRWFPVVSTRTYWVCPLEVAVETMEQTNKELKAIIQEAKSPEAPLHPLTMRLQGILDSAVQGGLVHYERAFLTAAYEARRPQHAALLQRLRDHIADQVPLLKYGLDVHACREPVRELHEHLAACFRRVQHHVHQRYGRRMCEFETDSISSPEVTLRTNLRDSAEFEPRNPSNRISDISTGNETTPKSKFKLNSAINWTRNSSSGTLTPRHKKRSRKSEVSLQSSGSQWYTSTSANGNIHSAINNAINSAFNTTLCNNAANNNSLNNSAVNNNSLSSNNTSSNNISSLCDTSASPLRELRQELVWSRPQRARAGPPPPERASNRDSLGTTDSNQDDEEPPPLPQKQSHRSLELDAENNNQEMNLPARHNYDLVISPRNSYLYQSRRRNTCDKLPPSNEKAPTPPPKKRNQNA